ncbi:DUF6331 family protein [Bremerella sp. P1]|uniref:DUF6331 family protein n=1 Tax=Bremerella sp. P1 TaxID=3026424 RepID=UPI002368B813|nr:DUF6331 family protein [Bremerella sp. P1]WDI43249.1 DUF6331 family protein [Bremerella sp. P1]
MAKPNPNDISIGEGRWIEFRNSDWQQAEPLDGDLKHVADFLNRLETECDAGCCGIDAYTFWEKDISSAVESFEVHELLQRFAEISDKIASRDTETYFSERMNNYFHRQTILALFEHIMVTLHRLKDETNPS